MIEDLAKLVAALGEQHAVIVGHDWGAPVAWSAAWTRPETFRAVFGISVPFAAEGLVGLPGNPFGELDLKAHQLTLAGPDADFYHRYFAELGAIIDEIEADLSGWLRDIMHSVAAEGMRAVLADAPELPPLEAIRQSAVCIPHGHRMRDRFVSPDASPAWLSETDLAVYVEAFERSGLHGGLNFYRNLPADQAYLREFAKQPLAVPSYFLGAEYDPATMWGAEALARVTERASDFRGYSILPNCGHWIQQECPAETNELLINFLEQL